jgi:hypothetical protein
VQDVNDLLKSMVLQDLGGGHINAVNFDSQDPLDKTLNSFAIQLTNNPTYTQILSQTRGENVEIVTCSNKCVVQGKIVGVESKAPATKDGAPVEVVNLWCPDGMRSVTVADVQRIKFLNPAVESEVQRALEVLSSGHDTQKKGVSLHFSGTGKRTVRVGYVVETPLWRTSYRLLVGKDGKLFVQGWAIVQNPTNEDWKDVRMSLVSGRPISFKMDLYQPMYSTRPTVQPQMMAAIAPTFHNGQFTAVGGVCLEKANPCAGLNGFGAQPAWGGYPGPTNGNGVPQQFYDNISAPTPQFRAAVPPQMQQTMPQGGYYCAPESLMLGQDHLRCTSNGVLADTTVTDLGDSFQYAIEHTVSVPRQKSALLPIVYKAMQSDKVSLYSPQTHAKYPLLALRLKNTTGVHLMQGPVAVFEGNGYAGDAQMPELRPDEERLVSYALDLGTEVATSWAPITNKLVSLRLHKGTATATSTQREKATYTVKNRGPTDRVVLVEHAVRPGYKLVSEQQPRERAKGLYRFEVKVAAGKTAQLQVVEELDVQQQVGLDAFNLDWLRYYVECEFANAQVKPALEKILTFTEKWMTIRQEMVPLQHKHAKLTAEQEKLRNLLKDTPVKADAYKHYLTKFDTQDAELEKLKKQIDDMESVVGKYFRECTEYARSLDLETAVNKAPEQRGEAIQTPVVPPCAPDVNTPYPPMRPPVNTLTPPTPQCGPPACPSPFPAPPPGMTSGPR